MSQYQSGSHVQFPRQHTNEEDLRIIKVCQKKKKRGGGRHAELFVKNVRVILIYFTEVSLVYLNFSFHRS